MDSVDLAIAYLAHLGQADKVIEEAIRVELKVKLEDAVTRRDNLLPLVDTAQKALEHPQAAVTAVDDEITEAENEIAARGTLTTTAEAMGDRVMARALARTWEEELGSLRDKRLDLVSKLGVVEADYKKALNAWQAVDMEVQFLEWNVAAPWFWEGQKTKAFRMWLEGGGATLILLKRNEAHPAYEAAKALLTSMCHINEVYPERNPADKLHRSSAWDEIRAKGTEVTVHNAHAEPENVRVSDGAGYVDDYRTRRDAVLPAPPVRQDNNMNVPMFDRSHLKP